MKPEEKEMRPEQKTPFPFDPIVLVRDAVSNWFLIVVVALIVGMAAYVYTDSGYEPSYSTTATLVLTTRDSSSTVYDSLHATSSLATVFTEILNSSVMRSNIQRELQTDALDATIYATAIESTNLLTVYVSSGSPRTAFQVMQILLEQHHHVTYEVMGDIVLEVLEAPTVPVTPSNAVNSTSAFRRAVVLSAAALFALLLAVSYFKDVVRSKDEAEEKLDCWCLGEIRHERKRMTLRDRLLRKKRSILITDPMTQFRYVTTLSKLSRRVEQHMHKGKVLLVTSVMENEGKSTVSANLALALSRKYPKVLLMDCDLRKPACRKIMGQEIPAISTQDVIRGKATVEQAAVPDKRSRLNMILAKRSNAREAAELIASGGLGAMIAQARECYDYVIIDLPPMSAAPDTEAVVEYVDASLLVIRQNGVMTTDLNRAIADLQRGEAKLLGCVINNVHSTELLSGEGYGTGYGRYGRYGGYGKYGGYGRYGRYAAYAQNSSEK